LSPQQSSLTVQEPPGTQSVTQLPLSSQCVPSKQQLPVTAQHSPAQVSV
jgi:hypothetical protein